MLAELQTSISSGQERGITASCTNVTSVSASLYDCAGAVTTAT